MANDDSNNNNRRPKPAIIFLPIPQELKDKGVKAITFAKTFISIDYKGRLFTFTVHNDDVTKTKSIFDKELDHEVDPVTKQEIWFNGITSNWLLHIYTEEEIQRDVFRGEGNAEIILDTAKKNCRLIFLDEYKTPYAAVMVNDHLEVLPISENRFKNWLRTIIAKEYKVNVINSSVIDEVANTLVAEAHFDIMGTKEKSLGLRFASDPDGDEFKWFYDLTNKEHEFISITDEGYKIVKNMIVFRRFNHQLPQVYPDPSYPLDIFEQFMNLLNVKKEDRLILKCYVIATFIPNLEKAILMIHGEQGTAKSMLQALLVMLVSPTLMKTITPQTKLDQFIQLLSHHPVVYFDNLSRIPEWMSDLLCRAVTGDAFSKRKHYTNDDDIIYVLMRAIGFNGINLAATKPDLLDRGLIIQTDTILDDNKRLKASIWKEFYRIRPQLLGYIMDILVKVLKWKKDNPGTALVKKLPRMADWGEWCEIIAHCMGEDEGAFMKAYRANINLQTEEVIEGSDLAIAIRELAVNDSEWRGTPTDLLTRLNITADAHNIDRRNKYWPKTAARLSRSLKLLQRTLREIGIEVRWEKDKSTKNNTRIIVIAKLPSEASEASDNSKSRSKSVDKSDGRNSSDSSLSSEKELPSDNKNENRAQNGLSDDRTASDDTLDIIQKSNPKIDFDVRKLIKCEGTLSGNKLVYDADPTTGILYITEKNPSFISGEIRTRGKDGGRYPFQYLEMIDKVFGPETNTIEVCSRSVKGVNQGTNCFTVDINSDCNPDLIADGQTLPGIPDNKFSRWRCDPPYNAKTAKKMYGTELPNTAKLLKEGARICKPDSLMFLLLSQNYQHCPKGVKRIGRISISVVPNNEERILNIFLKLE